MARPADMSDTWLTSLLPRSSLSSPQFPEVRQQAHSSGEQITSRPSLPEALLCELVGLFARGRRSILANSIGWRDTPWAMERTRRNAATAAEQKMAESTRADRNDRPTRAGSSAGMRRSASRSQDEEPSEEEEVDIPEQNNSGPGPAEPVEEGPSLAEPVVSAEAPGMLRSPAATSLQSSVALCSAPSSVFLPVAADNELRLSWHFLPVLSWVDLFDPDLLQDIPFAKLVSSFVNSEEEDKQLQTKIMMKLCKNVNRVKANITETTWEAVLGRRIQNEFLADFGGMLLQNTFLAAAILICSQE